MVTTVEMPVVHEWRLVAPWWFWPRRDPADPEGPGAPEARRAVRASRPMFQKYETPDLVNTFLSTPQRRLEFTEDDLAGPRSTPGQDTQSGSDADLSTPLKLYLASHHRHYLVVCSLHCDTAGFPRARDLDVCEAGFVVRRRVLDLPGGPDGTVARQLRAHAAARAKRIALEHTVRRLQSRGRAATLRLPSLQARLARLGEVEAQARDVALASAAQHAPLRNLQGWIPSGVDAAGHPSPLPPCSETTTLTPLAGVGAWLTVEELPEKLAEDWFPLSPLVIDPQRRSHDGASETIFFGVVPTGSSDLDASQDARFDNESDYEIRCFVRRHRIECDPQGGHCSCPITWSEPTAPYRLAGFFDLAGTAHRATTVQMPDLDQLRADAARLGPGAAGGLRFKSPVGSELCFEAEDTQATKVGTGFNETAQICSFAIPLITIVALFVLRLFLPIVVFIFQLWFLLGLRFCLPPDLEIDGGLAAEIDAMARAPEAELVAKAQVVANNAEFDASLDTLVGSFTGTEPGGASVTLAQKFKSANDPSAGTAEAQAFASVVSALFVQEIAPLGVLRFVPRVERTEVVRP